MDIYKENYNSKVLVKIWSDFIDRNKRRLGENGFLINTLKDFNCQKVFDACLGDWVDSIYLLKNNFNVISNDLDDFFIQKARENANNNNITLNITKYDWRCLNTYFSDNSFDAVCCLGNSLTYLFKKKDQIKALTNFFNIIRDNGILIIDERNYQYILDEKKEILNKGNFKYSGQYVYCGDKVHGKPIEISYNKVHFEYTEEKTGNKWYLVLYPFKKWELLSLLKEVGFRKIQQYSDYKKGFNSKADFYQYICKK